MKTNAKPETRNRKKAETRNPNLRNSDFGLLSGFGFRVSGFRYCQPLLAVMLGLAVGLAVTWAAGENPWHVFQHPGQGRVWVGLRFWDDVVLFDAADFHRAVGGGRLPGGTVQHRRRGATDAGRIGGGGRGRGLARAAVAAAGAGAGRAGGGGGGNGLGRDPGLAPGTAWQSRGHQHHHAQFHRRRPRELRGACTCSRIRTRRTRRRDPSAPAT